MLGKRLLLVLLYVCSAEYVAADPTSSDSWQDIPQQQLVYLEISDGVSATGLVVLQLADQFTPLTSSRFRQLVQAKFYDGLPFYRVIDQFVLQAGVEEPDAKLQQLYPALPAEFSWPVRRTDIYRTVQTADLLAAETGFNSGFAVGRDQGREWLIHCPNVVNMARDSRPNSATTDFAIMQGQAPRHLDRNMNVFARVIWGAEQLNMLPRGDKEQGGMLNPTQRRGIIRSARLGTELKPSQQLSLQQQRIDSADFQQMLQRRRERADEFYQYKGNGKLDICYLSAPVRLKTTQQR